MQVRQVLSYERDRVRFLLKAYLRARLEKVQRFAGKCQHAGRLAQQRSSMQAAALARQHDTTARMHTLDCAGPALV